MDPLLEQIISGYSPDYQPFTQGRFPGDVPQPNRSVRALGLLEDVVTGAGNPLLGRAYDALGISGLNPLARPIRDEAASQYRRQLQREGVAPELVAEIREATKGKSSRRYGEITDDVFGAATIAERQRQREMDPFVQSQNRQTAFQAWQLQQQQRQAEQQLGFQRERLGIERDMLGMQQRGQDRQYDLQMRQLDQGRAMADREYQLGLSGLDMQRRGQDMNYGLGLAGMDVQRRGQDINYNLGVQQAQSLFDTTEMQSARELQGVRDKLRTDRDLSVFGAAIQNIPTARRWF